MSRAPIANGQSRSREMSSPASRRSRSATRGRFMRAIGVTYGRFAATILSLILTTTTLAVDAPSPIVRLVRAVPAPENRSDIATCNTMVHAGAVVAGYTTTETGDEQGLII